MLEALRTFLDSVRPMVPLQMTEDFERLEVFADVLYNAHPQQVEILWPIVMQHTMLFVQEFMRLTFIQDLAPIMGRVMTGFFGSVEDEVKTGVPELEEFLQQHDGEPGSN